MHVVVVQLLSCVQLFVTPWTVVHQAPLSMGFSRQEYWSGLPFPLTGDLSDPGMNLSLLYWQMESLPLNNQGSLIICYYHSPIVKYLEYFPIFPNSNVLVNILEAELW